MSDRSYGAGTGLARSRLGIPNRDDLRRRKAGSAERLIHG